MKYRLNCFFIFTFITLSASYAKSFKVDNIAQYKEKVKTVVPGDTIVLANGVWNDAQLILKAKGEDGNYIYLRAETPGKVIFEGASCLRLSGEWLHISGLIFKNGHTPRGAVIEFKTGSKDYAYNCVLSGCVIDKYNQASKDSADHWVDIYGKKNTIEYCYFGGKTNEGTTLVVWPNDSNSINNGHLIYRNYFGPRPRLGSNGGESIRIGTSQVCMNSSKTIVDGNYFEHCNGEVEIISNKSCDNKFVNNTFFECEGSLVLRHGNRAIVSGNWFIGNDKKNTGGVRVINEGHQIYNNFFYKLKGDEFRSALAIMNAIPDSPLNGYAPVKNVVITNNTYYCCALPWAFCIGIGERNRIITPESTLILNNLVYCPSEPQLVKSYDKTDGIMLDNNLMIGSNGILNGNGNVAGEFLNGKIWNLDFVYSNIKAKKLPFVKYDILGQLRGEAVIGAFQNKGEKTDIELATAKNCGPEWYKYSLIKESQKVKLQGEIINVAAGSNLLYQAIKKANNGDILELEAGEHLIDRKMTINKNITIRAASAANTKPVIKLNANRANDCIFELETNACLRIKGIDITGNSKTEFSAKYAFTTSKNAASGYSLFIDNCEISDFNVEGGAIYKAYRGTIADSIKISNSVLRNSYRGFSLGDEKDNIGKYSAENVLFENTIFNKFTQYIIDYYRGGNDESTLGGLLSINHCVFNEVANAEKQTILKLTGIVNVSINNSIFNNSSAKTLVRLSGTKNSISNCCINNCVSPKIENEAKSQNLMLINPQFEKKSFVLSKKATLIKKGTDGENIGLR